MARLGARIRKGTMESMKTLGTAAVARSPMTPVTNVAKAFSVPGMLQSPTVGQGLKTTNGNMVRLGDVATYINGYAFKPADWSTEGVLIIRIQDLTGNSYKANRFKGKIDKRYEVLNGDVLISWSASLGVYVWSGEKAVLNQHIFKVQFDKTQVDKSFFVHQVECILKRAIGEAHGATMKHLTKPAFDALPFYLPDIQKQKSIADSLDKISHLIALRKRQLSKLDELVKSRFVEMFGDKGFPTRSWDRVFDATTGKLDSNAATEDGVYPFFTCAKSPLHIDYYAFDCEALLLAGNNAAGIYDVKYYKGKFNAYQRTYVLRLKDSNWQYVVFKTQLESKLAMLQSASKGTMTKYLTMGILKALQFVVPDNSLQREFAAFVEKVDKLEFKAKASLEKLETLKKAMMQKYFN